MESSPLRAIPLLSISSPCRGNIFSGTRSARGDGSSYRLSLEEKMDCGFGFCDVHMYENSLDLIYVLYKSKLLTLRTIGHSWYVLQILL